MNFPEKYIENTEDEETSTEEFKEYSGESASKVLYNKVPIFWVDCPAIECTIQAVVLCNWDNIYGPKVRNMWVIGNRSERGEGKPSKTSNSNNNTDNTNNSANNNTNNNTNNNNTTTNNKSSSSNTTTNNNTTNNNKSSSSNTNNTNKTNINTTNNNNKSSSSSLDSDMLSMIARQVLCSEIMKDPSHPHLDTKLIHSPLKKLVMAAMAFGAMSQVDMSIHSLCIIASYQRVDHFIAWKDVLNQWLLTSVLQLRVALATNAASGYGVVREDLKELVQLMDLHPSVLDVPTPLNLWTNNNTNNNSNNYISTNTNNTILSPNNNINPNINNNPNSTINPITSKGSSNINNDSNNTNTNSNSNNNSNNTTNNTDSNNNNNNNSNNTTNNNDNNTTNNNSNNNNTTNNNSNNNNTNNTNNNTNNNSNTNNNIPLELMHFSVVAHMVQAHHSIVVGTNHDLVNKMVHRLSQLSLPQHHHRHHPLTSLHQAYSSLLHIQGLHKSDDTIKRILSSCLFSDRPSCLIDVDDNEVMMMNWLDEYSTIHSSFLSQHLRQLWNERSPKPFQFRDVFKRVKVTTSLVLPFLQDMYSLPSHLSTPLLHNLMKMMKRKALVMMQYLSSRLNKTSKSSIKTSSSSAPPENYEDLITCVRKDLGLVDEWDYRMVSAFCEVLNPGLLHSIKTYPYSSS